MGVSCTRQQTHPQILVLGLAGSGKTTLVCSQEEGTTFEPTYGYNRLETVFISGGRRYGVWDVSGNEALRPLWPSFYKNIVFQSVVFVLEGENVDKFKDARRELHYLCNEEELRDAIFMVLVNFRSQEFEEESPRKYEEILELNQLHESIRIQLFLINAKVRGRNFQSAIDWLDKQINALYGKLVEMS